MRILWWIVGLPVSVALTILAVANRAPVDVSFYPFFEALSVPLFIVILGSFAAGVLVGSLLTWISGVRRRRAKRRREREQAREAHSKEQPSLPAAPLD